MKFNYTAEAWRDLEDIWEYIETDLNSPNAAERIVNKIMDDVDRLENFAAIGVALSRQNNL